ncbi:MAG: DUF938 domain-containing protein [Pseudomonadota bacterium]
MADSSDIRFSPAAERNWKHILGVLQEAFPTRGTVLEIASGSGQHVCHFAAALPDLLWQPSDPAEDARRSISALTAKQGLTNVRSPLDLDVLAPWPALEVDAVIAANMLHISAPETLPALMEGSANCLVPGGVLHLYGPFKVDGAFTSESNATFDGSLKQLDPTWGLRDRETVIAVAEEQGLQLSNVLPMPANNFSILFRRS